MSLQLILGNSGSGKSYTMCQKIIEESIRHPEQNFMVIVPEQFTMQTQKELVMLHPRRGIMNIDVLSFPRLAHRIFEETGGDRRMVLTETGKNLMIRRLAIELADELPVLGSRMNRTGYVSEVKSILSELMQYEVTETELGDLMKRVEDRPLLHAKLADIRKLYHAFLEYQREKFLKPEELLDVLRRLADRSKLLRRSTLAFDGFTGFTPSQLTVLEELMRLSPQIYVTVTIDARETWNGAYGEHELFALSKKTIRTLLETARCAMPVSERPFEIQDPIILGKNGLPRFRPGGELQELERNLFRPGRRRKDAGLRQGVRDGESGQQKAAGPEDGGRAGIPVSGSVQTGQRTRPESPEREGISGSESVQENVREGFESGKDRPELSAKEETLGTGSVRTEMPDAGEISLHVSGSPAGEVAFAARTISRLVKEQGYRYQDIAVITGNLSSYDNYVRKIFALYGIPAFIDQTRHILLNPCLEFVRGALMIVEQDFSAESVIRCLRTGLAELTEEETDRLENYLLASGIRGRARWQEPWSWYTSGRMEEEAEICNGYRERVMELFGGFTERMHAPDAVMRDYADALYELLTACSLQQKLRDQELSFAEDGEREKAKEYSQIYGILIGLLDEMVELLGDEKVTAQEFSDILDAGFAEAKVGIIPPGIDQVQIGDIERTRLAHVKILFFLGLNDGWVPSHGDKGGIVSDMEREVLKGCGADLAPTGREDGYTQRFYLYQNLTKPQDGLYLSWCRSSSDGTMMRPSYLVSVIRRLFPEISVTEEDELQNSLLQVTAPANGLDYLTAGLREARRGDETDEWREVYRTYLLDEDYADRVRELTRAAFLRGGTEPLSYTTSLELYGEVLENSVTRLEQFAACAFAHFAAYGLRLQEREQHGVRPVDLGIIFHRTMELFSKKLQTGPYDWRTLPSDVQREWMEQCVNEVTQEYGGKVLYDNARSRYMIQRVKRIMHRSVWALHQQLLAGSYTPRSFEISFSDVRGLNAVKVELSGGRKMHLQGRIDRIDTYETEDTVYVKIIDYKSGMTQFDPISLYYGLQLQLIVYLNAALEMEQRLSRGKQAVPAGIFYYHLQDPMLNGDSAQTEPEIFQALLKRLKPDGIVNSDREILLTLDHQIGSESLFVPAAFKKDGSLKAGANAISTRQFAAVSRFVRKKLKETGEKIMAGEISVSPAGDGKRSACDFCEYAQVCGFDKKLPGESERKLEGMSKEEAWERICEEGDEEEEDAEDAGNVDRGTKTSD